MIVSITLNHDFTLFPFLNLSLCTSFLGCFDGNGSELRAPKQKKARVSLRGLVESDADCGGPWQRLGDNRQLSRMNESSAFKDNKTSLRSQWRTTTPNSSSSRMAMPKTYSSTHRPTRTKQFPARRHPFKLSTVERKHQHTHQVMAQASAASLPYLDAWANKEA